MIMEVMPSSRMRLIIPSLAVVTASLLVFFQNCAEGLPDIVKNQSSTAVMTPMTGASANEAAPSCKLILNNGYSKGDGVYWLDPDGAGPQAPYQALCDMTTDGGGWMLIARNDQATIFTSFYKSWAEYKAGFGDLKARQSFGWLGNDRLNALTKDGTDLRVWSNEAKHFYSGFKVADEANKYKLSLISTSISQDAGMFAFHNGKNFSTYDRDNDEYPDNCAVQFKTGWWHHACYHVSIAGSANGQVYWRTPTGDPEYVQWIEMWAR